VLLVGNAIVTVLVAPPGSLILGDASLGRPQPSEDLGATQRRELDELVRDVLLAGEAIVASRTAEWPAEYRHLSVRDSTHGCLCL
jgi:hypothetical protein